MVCSPCEKRKKLLRDRMEKPSIHFKGTQEPTQIKIHGRLPIFCQEVSKTCVVAVFNQCCVVNPKTKCSQDNCMVGTPKFDEVLAEHDKNHTEEVL